MDIQTYEEPQVWAPGMVLNPSAILEKEVVHKLHLLHQSVHLLLVDGSRVYCRARSIKEERYSGMFTTTIGTHVELGKGYEGTLREFLPINMSLKPVGEFRVKDDAENEVCYLFTGSLRSGLSLPQDFTTTRHFKEKSELEELIEQGRTTPHLKEAYALIKGKL